MAKKTFNLDNPALQFISTPEEKTADNTTTPATAPEGYKINPLYLEKKSRRLQLLLKPSLFDKLKTKADKEGQSVNELIHIILEDALNEEE